jgi:hypothetical protein
MMTATDTLREIVTVATRELQDHERLRRDRDKPKALDIAARIFPAATLYASKAITGIWYYYLVMPMDWEPPANSGHWTHNYDGGYYWDSGPAKPWNPETKKFMSRDDPTNTEHGALVAGLRKLLDAL